jgi:hypothetical protein
MTVPKRYANIIDHYENCLAQYGDTHRGVDWPKAEDVDTRYRVMLDIMRFRHPAEPGASLLDFGCGASHLYEYMRRQGMTDVAYSGLDISEKFVQLSRQKFPDNQYYCVDLLEKPDAVPVFDYAVLNGIFTEKRELSFEEMFAYFQELLTAVFGRVRSGVAFNVMSKAVDWERWDLFHLPTDLLIDFLTKKLSRHFILRNDYGLYEYTVYLYK